MQIKKYALAALACAAMSVPVLNQASVAADDSSDSGSFYFKLKGGYNRAANRKISYADMPTGDLSVTDEEFDSMGGFAISGAVGYKLSDSVRAEVSYVYGAGNMEKRDENNIVSELKSQDHQFVIASYYDIRSDSCVTPFVGFGIGYASNNTALSGFDNTAVDNTADAVKSLDKDAKFQADSGLIGKIEAGVQFPLSEGINLEGSYSVKAMSVSSPKDARSKKLKDKAKFLDKDSSAIVSTADIYSATIEKGKMGSISHEVSAGISISF